MSSLGATSAIILAAGKSRRMGQFKPLMILGGRTVLQRVLDLFARTGIAEILIVTGYRSADVRAAAVSSPARCVENVHYEQGMFSSLLTGVNALSSHTLSFFVLPVDIPLVSTKTIESLITANNTHPKSRIIYPVFNGPRGHPPLIDACLIPEIVQWNGHDGLRGFLRLHEAFALEVSVADEAVLLDLDTLADHRRMEAMFSGGNRPFSNF